MRTFCIIIGSIAAVLGFLFSFFLDSFAFMPIALGLILGIAALVISKRNGLRDSVPKLIIALSFLAAAITTMNMFRENKVADDVKQTVKEKEQQEKEDVKEIEKELEGLE
ncbi:hypothetical protein H2O64_20665 [Kordia sp. YSTF-M3]|uniref:FUSC family protein n=1 Tax=Kordia aestuariivivens TaxID=2759037 RepID=A0ABR7QF26_9FLAO|nr:hypothetical protein [Kordia aestuariivivens]MBC8757098.1 hypothetical protein [Kordia aestuariivivens]